LFLDFTGVIFFFRPLTEGSATTILQIYRAYYTFSLLHPLSIDIRHITLWTVETKNFTTFILLMLSCT
jgi:hypothetical protein